MAVYRSEMIKLEQTRHPILSELYKNRNDSAYFPLIGAVLDGVQNGTVYADDDIEPRQFYVEHSFGFAQVFGQIRPDFERSLEHHFSTSSFKTPKVRLYTPQCPGFLSSPAWDGTRSVRQRLVIDPARLQNAQTAGATKPHDITTTDIHSINVASLDRCFGVAQRFWRSQNDFVEHSNAIVSLYRGQPAAICYAAAVANSRAEIDVLTLPEFRQLGAAKWAVIHFVNRCHTRGLQPLWDCFSNNQASLKLCRSVGFVAHGEPYPFFTINNT
jgi:hypothetical protein